jgi:hypothetical protein
VRLSKISIEIETSDKNRGNKAPVAFGIGRDEDPCGKEEGWTS